MNLLIVCSIVVVAIEVCLCQKCLDNQIYSVATQSCLQCSDSCQTCYNTDQSSCISCKINLFQSSTNSSTCVERCQEDEFSNKNQVCEKCQVYGCKICDDNQICLQCYSNFKLDLNANSCKLLDNVCPFYISFIKQVQSTKQCEEECKPTFYQNMETQTCEETVNCIQIQESQRFSFDEKVLEVSSINNNQYLIAANACTFALVDSDWNIITVQKLQNIQDYDSQYISFGQESKRKSFIIGDQGGCTAGSRLLMIDFKTLEVQFVQNDTINDYYVIYQDKINQIVFFNMIDNTNIIKWYDGINKQLNQLEIGTLSINAIYSFKNQTKASYIVQRKDFSYNVLTLEDDRSISIKSITKSDDIGKFDFIQPFWQKNNSLLSVFFDSSYYSIISRFDIQQDVMNQTKLEQSNQTFQFYLSYYSFLLNSLIINNGPNDTIQILIFNDQLDQIVKRVSLMSMSTKNFYYYEDLISNSTFAFIFSDCFQVVNVTEYLVLYNNGELQNFKNKFQAINLNILPLLSVITNVIFKTDGTMEVFICQTFTIRQVYRQQIRLRYNLSDYSYQIKYLNPYQSQILQYDLNNQKVQNQLAVTFTNQFNQNSFHVLDGYQNFINQTSVLITIKESLQNDQRIPRINTKIFNFTQTAINQQQILQFSAKISNQYIMLQEQIGTNIFQHIFDLEKAKYILSYKYSSSISLNTFNYIQKTNLLIVQNVPQIYSLTTQQSLLNSDQLKIFSLKRYVIVNEDNMLYTFQSAQLILYLLDFSTLQITQIFNFQKILLTTFWTLYTSSFQPAIFDNDIIYFCRTLTSPLCQPFSIKQKQFIYQQIQLQLYPISNPASTYQKTKEIFVFYYGSILICSFDLQNQTIFNLGIQYPSNVAANKQIILQNGQYVFYFDQTYFFKFDMELKQFQIIEAVTSNIAIVQQQVINFYTLGDTSVIKKSGSFIDTNDLIVIKSQQEDNSFIGQINMDDQQYHIFQSSSGVYWHKNLLNIPFKKFNLTQGQSFQDKYFENGQNLIAIYDSNSKNVIIFDLSKQIEQIGHVSIDIVFNLQIKMVDWNVNSFFYVKDSSVYLYNQQVNQNSQLLAQLSSNIIEYQYCFQQKIIVVPTSKQEIFIIKIIEGISIQVNTKFSYLNKQIVLQIKFILKCKQNLLVIYSPIVKIFDLLTGQESEYFSRVIFLIQIIFGNYQIYPSKKQVNGLPVQNQYQHIPIVDKSQNLLICFFSQATNFFERDKFYSLYQFMDYRQNNTNLYYDIAQNVLIGVTGVTKEINIMNIPGQELLYTYNTINVFQQGATYFFQEESSLILVDTTPIIYLCNYITKNITTYNIFIKGTQGIQIETNKRIIFLYSSQLISAFTYSQMLLIETFSLKQYNQNSILDIYINKLISVMIVQTSTSFIAFDLTEVLYTSETSLLQYQNVQNIQFNDEYQVFYSISNLSLNLFKNAKLVDSFLFETFKQNTSPYFTQPIKISSNEFLYITFNYLNIIQVNFENNSLEQKGKVLLKNTPDNFFYDSYQNQLLLIYKQDNSLNVINLQSSNLDEKFLTKLEESDFQNAFICSQYLVIPSNTSIQIINTQSNQVNKLVLPNLGKIKLITKLQIKQSGKLENGWWEIPFEDNQRINSKDQGIDGQFTKNILIIQKQDLGNLILIADLVKQEIIYSLIFDKQSVVNAVSDPFRQLIYIVTNEATTNIFSYSLQFITSIKNPCLKSAYISYDVNFVYSICPNDIIIYNGISFEQQFPTLNKGISEVNNLINMNYNNNLILIQKNKISIIQLRYNDEYETIYEYNQKNLIIHSFQFIYDSNNQPYVSLAVSNNKNISQLKLPLSRNKMCSIQIQQQNRKYENMYTKIALDQFTQSLQSYEQKITLIEIFYKDGQKIEKIDFQINQKNLDSKHLLSLSLQSEYSNNIYWNDNIKFSEQISNFFQNK